MIELQVLDWEAARSWASPIRYRVFCMEQGVPEMLERDDMDAVCLHCVAFGADQLAMGTGRLLPDGHIGRMAVLAEYRSNGVGGMMLERLVEEAVRRGDAAVMLNAQEQALDFYLRHGFRVEGASFIEAGIVHLPMIRRF